MANWRSVQTCSLEDPSKLTSGGYWRSTYGWCKRAVRILLECCLVTIIMSQGCTGNLFLFLECLIVTFSRCVEKDNFFSFE